MQFAQPYILNFIWALIGVVVFFLWANAMRQKRIEQFAQAKLLKTIAQQFSPRRLIVKQILFVLFLLFSIIALARPQWGFEWQEIKRQGVDILVVVDTSKSMLTQDVKPNRLERTKLAVEDLLQKLKGDRIGLMAFAGNAFLVCPLTADYNGFRLSLNDLNINTIPRGGTNISEAIKKALEAYKDVPSQYKAVIIVTDGDNLEGDPEAMAQKAKAEGVKIYAIGIGTKEGELIQVRTRDGSNTFLKDKNGNFIKSRLNETILKKIALITKGAYVKSSGANFGLDLLYDRDISKLEKRELESKMEKRFYERFQFPLFLAFCLLMVETCFTTRRS